MKTFVNFANPSQAATNKVVTQAFPETGQQPDVTTLAVGEEGGDTVTTQAIGEEGGGTVTTKAVGEEGGQHPTTLALGEEGGGQDPPLPPVNNTPFDQATRDFLGFLRDADTLQGRISGDGSLTMNEANTQLNAYVQQLLMLQVLQRFMDAFDLGGNGQVQNVYDQLLNRFQAGNKLTSFFNLFARPTGAQQTVEASDIRHVAFRDGERRNVSLVDVLLSLLY